MTVKSHAYLHLHLTLTTASYPLQSPDPRRVNITELGDIIVRDVCDDIIDIDPIRDPVQHIRDIQILDRTTLNVNEPDALAESRRLHAYALLVTACLNFTGLAAPSGPFVPHVGSSNRHPADLGKFDASVVNIDTCLGEYSHDLRLPAVTRAVKTLAASRDYINALVKNQCNTWSAVDVLDNASTTLTHAHRQCCQLTPSTSRSP